MKLVIDPQTEKGKTQLETIGWIQDNMNEALRLFFGERYRLVKGLHLEFRMKLDLDMSQKIKVDIQVLSPLSEERFEEGVLEAKKVFLEDALKAHVEEASKGDGSGTHKS